MQAIILSIGDELVSGMTVNTNATWLSQRLSEVGIPSTAHVTVGDQLLPIVEAVRDAMDHGGERGQERLLLITGGLGPTEDDLTRQAVADALQEKLVEDPDGVLQVEAWFKRHGRQMSGSNRNQAMRPQSARVLENTAGTAPGLKIERNGVLIFVLPGVPGEMRAMFEKQVLPELKERMDGEGGRITRITKINTFGVGESIVGERLKSVMSRTPPAGDALVGTTVHDGIVSVRVYATGTAAETEAQTERVRAGGKKKLGAIVFGEDEATIEVAVATLLKEGRYTVATAESCTGGLLATLLTNVAGSSAYFQRGWVTYANQAKHDELHVEEETLAKHGAVSEAVVLEMARGARRFSAATYALATTGIAGPDGGTTEKPVGTVWIGLAGPEEFVEARRFIFPGDRAAVRLRTSQMALSMLRWKLMGIKPPI